MKLDLNSDPSSLTAVDRDAFLKSRWFTRGWTLQELLAPELVVFVDSAWRMIGEKTSCRGAISSVTGVSEGVLCDPKRIFQTELYATRMSWAANRKTTQPEDISYCLLGIFDITIPLHYGEGGEKAFKRLQQALIGSNPSSSLMVWDWDIGHHLGPELDLSSVFTQPLAQHPVLANSPSLFSRGAEMHRLYTNNDARPWIVSNRGIETELAIITREGWFTDDYAEHDGIHKRYDLAIALLPYRLSESVFKYRAMLLSGDTSRAIYNRIHTKGRSATVWVPARIARLAKMKKVCLTDVPIHCEWRTLADKSRLVLFEIPGFRIQRVLAHNCEWNQDDLSLTLYPGSLEGFQEALLKIVHEKDTSSPFYIFLSDSVNEPEFPQLLYPESEQWRFRQVGVAVVSNDDAEDAFCDASGVSTLRDSVKNGTLLVDLGNVNVSITLETKRLLWDAMHTLTIETASPCVVR